MLQRYLELSCFQFNLNSFCWNFNFVAFCDPMESMFLPWMLQSGPSYNSKLRASGINYNDFCFHHLKTLLVENIVRQFYGLVTSFWLTCFVFLDVFCCFSIKCNIPNRAVWNPVWCHFFDISILFSSFCGCCQLIFVNATSWEAQVWNMKALVSVLYELCLRNAKLSDYFICILHHFD